MTGKAIGTELNQGYLGQVSRLTPIPETFTYPAGEAIAFGAPLKINDAGQLVAFANTDTADVFAGICTRSVQQATNYLVQNGETGYVANAPANVTKKGFVIVALADDSTPTAYGKVYLSADGFTATADGNLALPALRFSTGKVDANKRVEIEIGYLPMA